MDQEYKRLKTMRSLENVFRVVQKYRGLTGEDVNTGLSVGERLLLGQLYDMGIPLGIGND